MATISISDSLDVLEKYEAIMAASLGSDSVYIRAKETITALSAEGDLADKERATIISNVISSLTSSLVSAGLSTALQWASAEKDVALRKLQLAKELDILDLDAVLREAQADKMHQDSIATQANTIRMLGTPVTVDGKVQSLSDTGKVWQDIKVAEQQVVNMTKELEVSDARLKEVQASVHRAVADTVTNFGAYTYSLTEQGLPTAPILTTPQAALQQTVSFIQREAVKEQTKLTTKQIQQVETQTKKVQTEDWVQQANALRMYGTPVLIDGVVTDLSEDGKLLWDTKLVQQQETNLQKEANLIESRIKESQVNTHRAVADTVVNHGSWRYSVSEDGFTSSPTRLANTVIPLSDIQRIVATEQAKGYGYNAWANSVTASAGMLGTAIASDGAISEISDLITLFRTSLQKLQDVSTPTIPSV